MRRLPSFLLIGLLSVPAAADTLHLHDGSKLEGDVKRNNEGWVVIGTAGKMTYVRPEDVKSIQMAPATNPSAHLERINSLRRSTENLGDLKTIIDRYEKFLATAPDGESKKMAEADLAEWKNRQQQGMVKLGSQWVSADEKAKVQEASLNLANQGRDYIKQGRLKEAEPILTQALSIDPGNASAHYLKGVLAYRQDQFPAARKEFEDTLKLVPDHAPTLNNLAVTLSRQNQVGASFHNYDRAMMVAPTDRALMSNAAEALQAQPPDARNSDAYRRAARRYDEAILQLEQKMAQEGLYRWGAAWVPAAEMEKLKAADQANKAKLDEMAIEFDATQARIKQIEDNIAENERDMRSMESDRLRYDSTGRLIRTALPSSYYRRQEDNQKLLAQRAQELTKLEKLRAQARTIEGQLPVPRFTGQQQLIGAEGTPLVPIVNVPAAAPSTQPGA